MKCFGVGLGVFVMIGVVSCFFWGDSNFVVVCGWFMVCVGWVVLGVVGVLLCIVKKNGFE